MPVALGIRALVLGTLMKRPINLDREPLGHDGKIDHESRDRMLAAHRNSMCPELAQDGPSLPFRQRGFEP